MKNLLKISLLMMLLMVGVASASFYYTPMNFYEQTNHTFEINITGEINVTIPTNFTLIGNNTGNDSIGFILQSPIISNEESELFVGQIFINGTFYSNYYLLYINPEKIVDTKIEVGHGDFNYIDTGSYIGEDNLMLFNLVRVWGVGTDILNEVAMNVSFNCTYPLIIPNTVDSKYDTEYNSTNVISQGWLDRLRGTSLFRLFVLSQEVDQDVNTSYNVSCTDLTYQFNNTEIIAPIPGFNLNVRSIEPLVLSMSNGSEYVTYTIMNNELYDLRDLEFVWEIGTDSTIENLASLDIGEIIQFNVPTNESGDVNLTVRFIPEWMFNSRSPIYYQQSRFDTYYTPDYLDGLEPSDYYDNQSVDTTPILETQQMDFSISILQNSPFGGAFKVTYLFYDDGVLVDTVERQIVGVQDHQISFSSTDLDPEGLEEDYDVYTIVSIYDENGDWYDFPQEMIGVQVVAALTDNGPQSQVGYYDVIVNNRADRYEDEDVITADIIIKNTGDTPDEDTVLTYYLIGPDGERFGESVEQILEVPVGTTTLTRSITLPLGANLGEWEFHADYETVVQPIVAVHDSFEVVTGLTIGERFNNSVVDFSVFGWQLLWLILLLLFILFLWLIGRRKRKK